MSSIIICLQDAGNGEVEVAVSYEGEPFNAFSAAHRQGKMLLAAAEVLSNEQKANPNKPGLAKFLGLPPGESMPMPAVNLAHLASDTPH